MTSLLPYILTYLYVLTDLRPYTYCYTEPSGPGHATRLTGYEKKEKERKKERVLLRRIFWTMHMKTERKYLLDRLIPDITYVAGQNLLGNVPLRQSVKTSWQPHP